MLRRAPLWIAVVTLAAGCSSPYVHRIEPVPTSHRYVANQARPPIPAFRQVAILPFADYSELTFLQDRGYPNNAVIEQVTDQFVAQGVSVIPQEDVEQALFAMGVLPDLDEMGVMPDSHTLLHNGPHTFNHEFDHHSGPNSFAGQLSSMGYSPQLAAAIGGHSHSGAPDAGVTTDDAVRVTNKVKTRHVYGLTQAEVAELGRRLGVDAVVRGRILEYGLKKTPTIDPAWGLGIVSRVAMGLDWLLFDWKDSGDFAASEPREEVRHDIDDHRFHPGANPMGPIATLAGGPTNVKSSAVVQVRLYIQDGATGSTLWTNRAEVETTPFSIFHFNEQHLKELFDDATRKAVVDAMDSFFYGRERWGAVS